MNNSNQKAAFELLDQLYADPCRNAWGGANYLAHRIARAANCSVAAAKVHHANWAANR